MARKISELPSLQKLVDLLEYCPITGVLRFRSGEYIVYRNGGYWHLRIERRCYLAHRIIWKLMTGHDPSGLIDHIDTDGTNNKWNNLREANHAENIRNSRLSRANKSGIKGVSFDRANNKWRASITVDRKAINLGRYSSIEEAKMARIIGADRFHGEFARLM